MIIKIKNLQLETIIGIYDWEKSHKRKLMINAQIKANDRALQSDRVQDAIDYDVIIDKIKNVVNNSSVQLIEKLVGNILDEIMKDLRIKECTLEIDKLGVYDFLDSFSVTQTRKNDSVN